MTVVGAGEGGEVPEEARRRGDGPASADVPSASGVTLCVDVPSPSGVATSEFPSLQEVEVPNPFSAKRGQLEKV